MITRKGYKLNLGMTTVTSAVLAFVTPLVVTREGQVQRIVSTLAEVATTPRGVYYDAGAGKLTFATPGSQNGFYAEKITIIYKS